MALGKYIGRVVRADFPSATGKAIHEGALLMLHGYHLIKNFSSSSYCSSSAA